MAKTPLKPDTDPDADMGPEYTDPIYIAGMVFGTGMVLRYASVHTRRETAEAQALDIHRLPKYRETCHAVVVTVGIEDVQIIKRKQEAGK